MARDPKFNFTYGPCPGSGQPPYRYVPGFTEPVKNPKTGRIIYAQAICEVCGGQKAVNVKGVLRSHQRRIQK